MRKKIIFGIFVTFILGTTYLGYEVLNLIESKKEVETSIKTLPEFRYRALDGKVFGSKDLINIESNKVFIFFNTECEFCIEEAKHLNEKIGDFGDSQLILISSEKIEGIKIFSEEFGLNRYTNVYFLQDTAKSSSKVFGAKTIPYHLVYDAKNSLVFKHKGVLKLEELISKLP